MRAGYGEEEYRASFWDRCGVELADGHETYRRIWFALPDHHNLDYRTITVTVDEELGNNTR